MAKTTGWYRRVGVALGMAVVATVASAAVATQPAEAVAVSRYNVGNLGKAKGTLTWHNRSVRVVGTVQTLVSGFCAAVVFTAKTRLGQTVDREAIPGDGDYTCGGSPYGYDVTLSGRGIEGVEVAVWVKNASTGRTFEDDGAGFQRP